MNDIIASTMVRENEVENLINDLANRLNEISRSFSDMLLGILNQIEAGARGHINVVRFLRHQFLNYYREMLIKYLSQKHVLPAYGFPIDVIDLMAGKHKIQRSVFTAVSEFTPGSNITIAHEKYSVDALAASFVDQNHTTFTKYKLVTCEACGAVRYREMENNVEFTCSCGRAIVPDIENRRGCSIEVFAQPRGFKSFARNGRDAASSTFGRVFANVDMKLVHGDVNVQLTDFGTPPRAQFKVFPFDDDTGGGVLAHCINRGRYGQGYLIDTRSGQAISYRESPAVGSWTRAHRNHISSPLPLACAAQVSALLCLVPCTDNDKHAMPFLGGVLGAALQVAAVRLLEVDAREIQKSVESVPGAYAIYLYDSSGTSGYMEELDAAHDAILREALDLVKTSPTLDALERKLVNHTTARDLRGLSEAEVVRIAQWATNNEEALTLGRFRRYSPSGEDGIGYEVESVGEYVNPLVGKSHEEVCVLVGWCPEQALIEGIAGFVGFNKLRNVRVILDKLENHGCPETVAAILRDRMNSAMRLIKAQNPDTTLVYHEVDYSQNPVGNLYRQGFRLRVGDTWYIEMPSSNGDGNVPSQGVLGLTDESVAAGYFKNWLKVTQTVDWRLPADSVVPEVDLQALIASGQVSSTTRMIWTHAGERLRDRTIASLLTELGFDYRNLRVKSVKYDDPYFYTPAEWMTLKLWLRELAFVEDSKVEVRAAAPTKGKGYEFWMPSAGVDAVRCGVACGDTLQLDDARKFAEYVLGVCRRAGLKELAIDYTDERLAHGRVMTLVCEQGGKESVHRFVFDRGMDLLNFADRRFTVPLCGSAIEGWVGYTGDFYVVYEGNIEKN